MGTAAVCTRPKATPDHSESSPALRKSFQVRAGTSRRRLRLRLRGAPRGNAGPPMLAAARCARPGQAQSQPRRHLQNHGIHQMYIIPRFSLLVASAISLSVCPSAESGRLGFALTPTTTPSSLLAILLMASRAGFISDDAEELAHSTKGSCTNVSSTLRRVSLFERRTFRVVSHDFLKTPSYPDTPMASIMFWVRRKGTTSGFSSASPLSKRHEKSTCTQSPLLESIRTFSPCLSPKPTMWPHMLHTAQLLENLSLDSSHKLGSGKCCKNHLCSLGGNRASTLFSKMAW
mmetsp:Transcript_13032/g.32951  ORF Transcript_13032/g.32951 Transcript_13032/m.32951 type:complete len:289 (-) Transcript_13032:505-1371(-)